MSINQIAAEALRLPEKERAGLAAQLLNSLPAIAVDEDDGVAEALRRDAELDADPSQGMSLEELNSEIERHRKP